MAKDKKSFIVYVDWKVTFDALPDADAGKLIKHLFAYVNDENPKTEDVLINAVFANIKQTLKRDLRKYEGIIVKRAETGRSGGIASGKARRTETITDEPTASETKQIEPNASIPKQIEHGTVTVNDNGINNNIINPVKKSKNDFLDQIIQAFVDVHGDYEVISPGKERMATAKLLGIYKKKYPRATSEETIAGLKSYFEACVAIPDDWLRTNMSIPIIVSNFNRINQILKHGNKKIGATTDLQLAEIVAKHFAND